MMDITVLVMEGAFTSGITVTLDVLTVAEGLAKKACATAPRWRVCSLEGGPIRLANGILVETTKLTLDKQTEQSLLVIPGLNLRTPNDIHARLNQPDARKIQKLLVRHAAQGGRIAVTCSAVFLLQDAGLLKDKRVTTTWWLGPVLQKLEPECRVDADRMICVDGAITTAGAAFAQMDLMLHLLREHTSPRLAELVSKVLLIDGREAQSSFMVPEVWSSGNNLISRLSEKVQASLPEVLDVGSLAREFCMSERTLSRHVHKATGKTTVALIQSVRLRHARRLLESSRLTVEQVALAVGYQDATSLRKAMRSRIGVNPSRFRPGVAVRAPATA